MGQVTVPAPRKAWDPSGSRPLRHKTTFMLEERRRRMEEMDETERETKACKKARG